MIKTLWHVHWINDTEFVIESLFFPPRIRRAEIFFDLICRDWQNGSINLMQKWFSTIHMSSNSNLSGMLINSWWSWARKFYTILASKSKKSVSLTMLRRSSLWIFQLFNTTTMGLSILVSVRPTRLERILICETSLFVDDPIVTQLFMLMLQSKVEASIREFHRF